MHGPSAEAKRKDKTERPAGPGRRTREEMGRESQMAVLRFQTMEGISGITGLLSGPRVTATEKRG